MQDVSEHFRGSGFAIFAKLLETSGNRDPRHPRAHRRLAQVLRPDERLCPTQGLPGMGYIFWREGR
jgi:aspartyl-tRNA synthetase